MSELFPRNKYLLVKNQEVQAQSDTPKFLLPDNYKKNDSPYSTVVVVRSSPESEYFDHDDCVVVVPTNMLEEVDVGSEKFLIVPEHAVVGVLEGE